MSRGPCTACGCASVYACLVGSHQKVVEVAVHHGAQVREEVHEGGHHGRRVAQCSLPELQAVLQHVELVGLVDVGAVEEDGEEEGVADGGLGAQCDEQALQSKHDLDLQQALALGVVPHLQGGGGGMGMGMGMPSRSGS